MLRLLCELPVRVYATVKIKPSEVEVWKPASEDMGAHKRRVEPVAQPAT